MELMATAKQGSHIVGGLPSVHGGRTLAARAVASPAGSEQKAVRAYSPIPADDGDGNTSDQLPVAILVEHFSRLGALLFTAMAWIFIPAYCFAIP